MCLAYERKHHIFKGIGYIFLQTLVKSYDRSETKDLGCFLEKLSKEDRFGEEGTVYPPLGWCANLKKKKNGLGKVFF